MPETIEYEPLEQGPDGAPHPATGDLSRLGDVPLELSVELGRARLSLAETLDLGTGSVLTLDRPAGATADLLVNGTAIARGEVVVVDERYALRITEIIAESAEPEGGGGAVGGDPRSPSDTAASADPSAATGSEREA